MSKQVKVQKPARPRKPATEIDQRSPSGQPLKN